MSNWLFSSPRVTEQLNQNTDATSSRSRKKNIAVVVVSVVVVVVVVVIVVVVNPRNLLLKLGQNQVINR